MSNILILSAPYGNGHKFSALALEKEFNKKNINVTNLDYYDEFCPKELITVSRNIHKKSFTWWGRQGYKLGFWASNVFFNPNLSSNTAIGRKNFEKYIVENNINKVIITFPIAAIFAVAKKYKDVDFYEVVTDFSMHKKWQNPHVKNIFVGCKELVEKYPKLKNIYLSGIPIITKKPLDIKMSVFKGENKTVSVILGASGIIDNNLDFITKISEDYHVNVICGKNKSLFKKLEEKFQTFSNINVWGFISDVENLYSASDLVITKSGGATSQELIYYKTKALLFEPQFGQELDNAKYLEKYNIAKIIDFKQSINRQILFMLNIESEFDKIRIENSAQIICEKVLENENK